MWMAGLLQLMTIAYIKFHGFLKFLNLLVGIPEISEPVFGHSRSLFVSVNKFTPDAGAVNDIV